MFARMKQISIRTGLCASLAFGGQALAATKTFTASSGNWSASGNWSGGNLPLTGDDVVINTNSACTYDLTSNEPTIKSITVSSGASLTIGSGKDLELASDGASSSALTGNITLTSSTSGIILHDTHTITGSGKIIGQNDGAFITIADLTTLTLGSSATIEGNLTIKETSGTATFVNQGTVHANATGTLWVNTRTVDDSSTGLWRVSTANSVLRFDPSFSSCHGIGPMSLEGDFTVEAGELDVDCPGFNTSGTLTWTGGTINCATNNGGPAAFTGS